MKYLVTAPIERPQRPIREIFVLLLKYETTILRSFFWHKKKSHIHEPCIAPKSWDAYKKEIIPHANQD